MRKLCIIVTGLCCTLLFTTCKQYSADIENDLSYWSSVVTAGAVTCDKPSQINTSGAMCIPSVTDVAFALKVRNPKHFTLVTPTSSADAGRVIRFPHLSPQPVYGTDYTLRQTASDTLILTYKSAFLQRHEWGNGNIGAEITFISTDGRVFGDRFNLNIRSDSAPVLESAGIGKTAAADASGNHYYVLLFRVKNMDTTATAGTPPTAQLRHKDLNNGKLIVTKGSGSPVEIPLTFNSGNTDFTPGANLLAASDVEGISLPSSTPQDWILRLKTDVKVSDPETPYFVSVTDTQGCSSAVVEAKTSRTAVLKLKQNFNSTDPAFHCISTADKAYISENIISDAAQYTNTNPLVIYPAGTSPSVRLELTATDGAAVKYKLDNGAVLPATSSAQAEIPVTGSTPVHTLEVWTVMGAITSPSVTVHIKVADAVSTYSQLKNVVQHTPENGTEQYKYNYSTPLNIHIGSGLTASANTEIAITGGKKLKLSSLPAGNVHTVNANNSGRIFKVSWPGTELTLEDIKLTDGNTADGIGGAVHVETGGKLVLKGKTVITPSTGGDENTPGKNDVYLASGASIKVDGALAAAEPIVARITPANYTESTHVLVGAIAAGTPPNENYKRFSVTPQTSPGQEWKIDNTGKLKKAAAIIDGSEGGAWEKLKAAVAAAQDGDTIKINGTITATNGGSGDNRGVINITKNITIERAAGAPTAVLNADRSSLGSNAHPIFRVSGGTTLKLKNLTLKGGQNSGTFGGAINVTGGLSKAELTDCIIEDCQAGQGGAIGCGKGTAVTLTNTTIQNCKAHTPVNNGTGGAIYASGATVTLTNCTFKGNEAQENGGAIHVEKADAPSFAPSTVTIEGGTIGGTGTDANKATGSSGEGGGIYVGTNCTLNMQAPAGSPTQGVQLIGNTAAKSGGGIYAAGGTVNITNCTLKGNTAEKNGGAIYAVKNSTTPSTVTISGGTIGGAGADANKATGSTGSGGGIYVGDNCTLTLQNNVQVTGNTAHKGTGIYVKNAIVVMQDTSSHINTNNDVYLHDAKIRADSTLNPPGGIAARITVPDNNYLPSTQVLIDGTGVTLANETYKFLVTPKSGPPPEYWIVKNDGCLTNNISYIFANISKNQIQAAESSMIYTNNTTDTNNIKITDRQTKLLNKLILYKTNIGNYGIMHVTEVHNTNPSGFGHIKFNYKTFNDGGTVKNAHDNREVKGTFFFDLDEESTSETDSDFWLENTGTASSTRHFTPKNGAKFYVLP